MDRKYMNCTRCELCGTAETIYSNQFVEYSILFRLLASPLATMGVSMLSAAVFKSTGIHINSKILLIMLTISAIICNSGILIDSLYKFFISYVMPDTMQCDYQVFHPQYFICIRNIQLIGATLLSISPVFLGIERTVATVFYRTYSTTKKPFLGLVLVIIQLILCIIPIFYVKVPKQSYPYIVPELHDFQAFHYFSMCETLLNIVAILIFTLLAIVNRFRKRIMGNGHLEVVLARYDLHSNISTTTVMIPIVILISIMVFSGEIIMSLFLPEYDPSTIVNQQVLGELIDYSPYAEFQLSLIPLLLILLVLTMLMVSSKLRQSFLCVSHLSICFPTKSKTDTRSTSESSDTYFSRVHWSTKSGLNPRHF